MYFSHGDIYKTLATLSATKDSCNTDDHLKVNWNYVINLNQVAVVHPKWKYF